MDYTLLNGVIGEGGGLEVLLVYMVLTGMNKTRAGGPQAGTSQQLARDVQWRI